MRSFLFAAAVALFAPPLAAQAPAVTLTDDATAYTLQNASVTAKIDKASGSLVALSYLGKDMLGGTSTRNGYWSMPGTQYRFGTKHTTTILEDPTKNNGERATIACAFGYDGDAKSVPADVELRYSLGRDDHGIYLEAIWNHQPGYPALSFPVGRFAAKLNDDLFDWMTVDARRNMKMLTASDWNHGQQMNMKEARLITSGVFKGQVEHKYDYAAVQFDTPAYGWSSTSAHVGIWIVNPSFEYMSGGPSKLELSTHRDATFTHNDTAPAPPTLLEVWKGPHYGGTALDIPSGESWTRVVGPFLLYCNDGPTPEAMWHDALATAAKESQKWPYPWAQDALYPGDDARATVSGSIVLHDPQQPAATMKHLLVGLGPADYTLPNGAVVDWQLDAKDYQFWVRATPDGHFTIPHVRPGRYTLYAFADGVLGEFSKANIEVIGGQPLSLGSLTWKPVRYGKQLWEIGNPDRTAGEFLHGDHYWTWGLYNQYPKDFPHDVNYTIGKSDFHKDWNLMQVPRVVEDSRKARGEGTTWAIHFDLPQNEHGLAVLRIAFAGTEIKSLDVGVNGTTVETLTGFANTSVIHRDSDRGYWTERDVAFDAKRLKSGKNSITLSIPNGTVMNGVEYDYLRLELNEDQPAPNEKDRKAPPPLIPATDPDPPLE